jgi:hypothetical protein
VESERHAAARREVAVYRLGPKSRSAVGWPPGDAECHLVDSATRARLAAVAVRSAAALAVLYQMSSAASVTGRASISARVLRA